MERGAGGGSYARLRHCGAVLIGPAKSKVVLLHYSDHRMCPHTVGGRKPTTATIEASVGGFAPISSTIIS
jgi:hypothetical protein